MNRGGKFLVSTTILMLAACMSDGGKLEVRAIKTPLAPGAKPVPFRIAEARGQLALGNVALALEAFRKALRDDPNSIDAFAGMAACYDRMGRFDLSRRNYETALALAPADVGLLGAFAQSLQLQGQYGEAQRVQAEIAQRQAANAVVEVPQLALRPAGPVPMPNVAATTAEAPPVDATVPMALTASVPPVAVEQAPTEIAIPRPVLSSAPVEVAHTSTPGRTDVSVPDLPEARVVQETAPVAPAVAPPQRTEHAALGQSVTIKLPPARGVETAVQTPIAAPAEPAPIAMAAAPDLPPLMPYHRPVPRPTVADEQGPRLERLSMGEIGLITAPGPMWRTAAAAGPDHRSTAVRWVSLREASAQPTRVRLLNAARVNRLASRTRSWLVARGWSSMAIGDAPAARSRSVIVYPPRERTLAKTLANQFGFAMQERTDAKFVTMLLGSDAARLDELRPQRA